EWAFGADEVGRELEAESQSSAGASIAGRRTYDSSVPWWGADGPGGSRRTLTFIVSHGTPEAVPQAGAYPFVGSPLEAVERAREVAGDKDIDVFSPDIARQLLQSGLVDELHLHVAPVLLGAGTRLFESSGDTHIQLEPVGIIEGSKATHLRYRVLKDS